MNKTKWISLVAAVMIVAVVWGVVRSAREQRMLRAACPDGFSMSHPLNDSISACLDDAKYYGDQAGMAAYAIIATGGFALGAVVIGLTNLLPRAPALVHKRRKVAAA